MSDQPAAAAAAKPAKSQNKDVPAPAATAAQAPRKVRFNVGQSYRALIFFSILMHDRDKLSGIRRSRGGCLRHCLLRVTQAYRTEGCHQKDRTIRPLYVLPANAARIEATQVFE